MTSSESPTRLSGKVQKHEENIVAHSDEIVKILKLLKRHSTDLTRIDGTVTRIDGTVARIDGTVARIDGTVTRIDAAVSSIESTVSALDSRVDDIETGQNMLRLEFGTFRSDVKTVDGRLVKAERTMSRHGEMLEEILERLKPATG